MNPRQRNISFLGFIFDLEKRDATVLLSQISKLKLEEIKDGFEEVQEGEIVIGELEKLEKQALAYALLVNDENFKKGIILFLRLKISARLGYSGVIRIKRGWKITTTQEEQEVVKIRDLAEAEAASKMVM